MAEEGTIQQATPLYDDAKFRYEEQSESIVWWADYWKERAFYWHKKYTDLNGGISNGI